MTLCLRETWLKIVKEQWEEEGTQRGDKAPRGGGRFEAVLLNVMENGHEVFNTL